MENGKNDLPELVFESQDSRVADYDWGRKAYRDELLRMIEGKQNALNDQDAAGHIYWNQFKELVESIKP